METGSAALEHAGVLAHCTCGGCRRTFQALRPGATASQPLCPQCQGAAEPEPQQEQEQLGVAISEEGPDTTRGVSSGTVPL